MGRSTETIKIMVSVEPSEHERDAEFLLTLKRQVGLGVRVTQDLYPDYFIDTMGLD